MEDTLWSALTDTYVKLPMALTAEKLAEQYGITREECDQFALTSQKRWQEGIFHSYNDSRRLSSDGGGCSISRKRW